MINSQTAVVCTVVGLIAFATGISFGIWPLWVPGGLMLGFGVAGILTQ